MGWWLDEVRDERVDARFVVDDVNLGAMATQLGVRPLLQLPQLTARPFDFDEYGAAGGYDDPVGHSPAGR